MTLRRVEDARVEDRRVLVRVDFNVPMKDGRVTDATRLMAAIPTIELLKRRGAKIILLAHFGRPRGARSDADSLKPIAPELAELLAAPVAFADDCVGPDAETAIAALKPGGVLLLENTRFHAGEEKGDHDFARRLAALGDVYVNDAFSAAHRAHASTAVIAQFLPAFAGKSMQAEIDHLTAALVDPKRPVLALVGGAKVSTKLDLLKNLVTRVDQVFVGGGMANTFLHAKGFEIGASLAEKDMVATARIILEAAAEAGCDFILPRDVVVAREFVADAPRKVVEADAVEPGWMILDCGPETVDALADTIDAARTLIWNGPLGAFETPPFETATLETARYAAGRVKEAGLVAIAGGGDTVAALNMAGVARDFTYVSTAGGAFLEWMEGKTLPGVEALEDRS